MALDFKMKPLIIQLFGDSPHLGIPKFSKNLGILKNTKFLNYLGRFSKSGDVPKFRDFLEILARFRRKLSEEDVDDFFHCAFRLQQGPPKNSFLGDFPMFGPFQFDQAVFSLAPTLFRYVRWFEPLRGLACHVRSCHFMACHGKSRGTS